MWSWIKSLYRRVPSSMSFLSPLDLPKQLQNTLTSKIYYTPKLQHFAFTEQLGRYLRYLHRKDKLNSNDMRALTEAIITEYGVVFGLQEHPKTKQPLKLQVTKDFEFKPNELSPFHGRVNYMLWLNDKHMVPLLFFQKELNPVAGIAAAHACMGLKSMVRGELRNSGYSIITTGQEWQMFKVYYSLRAEKTVIYEGRNRFRNIIEDWEMVQAVIGLIDECMQTSREDVQILKLAYELIDEKRFMLEGGTKEVAMKASPVSRMLRSYFNKKEEADSK